MPSLVAKKKGNKLYYYVVESARVEGKPRIVHQAYLGTAEKLAEMVRDRTAPIPLAASLREFGSRLDDFSRELLNSLEEITPKQEAMEREAASGLHR